MQRSKTSAINVLSLYLRAWKRRITPRHCRAAGRHLIYTTRQKHRVFAWSLLKTRYIISYQKRRCRIENGLHDGAERERLAALRSYEILDSFPEATFDNITLIASQICETPVALVSLIDENRLWFKSKVGLSLSQIDRDNSFCVSTMTHAEPIFEIPSTKDDPRFANNPLVTAAPYVAFYAAAPLATSSGFRLGTLCVIDQKPRCLTASQRQVLRALADQVMVLLEARKAEKTARKTIIDSIPQITFAADPRGYVYEYNRHWYDYVGAAAGREGDNGQNSHVIHPDDNDLTNEMWQKSMQAGLPYEVSHRIRRHDGMYRWHICRATPIRNETGEIVSWFGTSTDIHEPRSRAESTQNWLEQMLSLLPKPLFMIDLDARKISSANKASEEMFKGNYSGLTTDANRGENVQLLDINGNLLPIDLYPSNRIVRGETLQGHEFAMTIFGRYYHLEAFSATLPIVPGQARAAILLLNDITALKATEANLSVARNSAESANIAKSQFLANMSHEIRTPLGAIMGFSDLMKSTNLSETEMRDYMSAIDRNSRHLLRIVDDILDLSKVEAGMMVIEKIEFSLLDVVSDVASLMRFKAEEKGVSFDLNFATAVPETVISDPTRIRQILSNLLGNGIKFTHQGKVAIEIAYENSRVHLTVSDTGIGLSEEQAERLFKPFQQADASTTRKFGGTGLGLVLTQKLTQAMGGSIELLHSQLDRGTTFRATLQVALPNQVRFVKPTQLSNERPLSRVESAPDALEGMRVLLIEDSPDIQILVKFLLARFGASVDYAGDGIEGVEKAFSQDYDIVLCDLQMPRMDGYQAVAELRSRGYQVPIVALTAHAMKAEYDKAMSSGFSDYLTKPIHLESLIGTLNKYCGSKARARAPGGSLDAVVH